MQTFGKLAAVFFLLTGSLMAANNVIFVHGRSPGNNHCGWDNTDYANYWSTSKDIELNSYITSNSQRWFAGYYGSSDPRQWTTSDACGYGAQDNIDWLVKQKCTGANTCKIVCHSAGCYAVDYYLSQRVSTYGVDFAALHITWVMDIAAATGGSELAGDAAWWGSSEPMTLSLIVSTARSFNHNQTSGVQAWHIAGYDGGWSGAAALLPGEDDGAVSFHSACGRNTNGSYDDCEADGAPWTNHYIWKDTAESNYQSGCWWPCDNSTQAYYKTHSDLKNTGKSIWNRYH